MVLILFVSILLITVIQNPFSCCYFSGRRILQVFIPGSLKNYSKKIVTKHGVEGVHYFNDISSLQAGIDKNGLDYSPGPTDAMVEAANKDNERKPTDAPATPFDNHAVATAVTPSVTRVVNKKDAQESRKTSKANSSEESNTAIVKKPKTTAMATGANNHLNTPSVANSLKTSKKTTNTDADSTNRQKTKKTSGATIRETKTTATGPTSNQKAKKATKKASDPTSRKTTKKSHGISSRKTTKVATGNTSRQKAEKTSVLTSRKTMQNSHGISSRQTSATAFRRQNDQKSRTGADPGASAGIATGSNDSRPSSKSGGGITSPTSRGHFNDVVGKHRTYSVGIASDKKELDEIESEIFGASGYDLKLPILQRLVNLENYFFESLVDSSGNCCGVTTTSSSRSSSNGQKSKKSASTSFRVRIDLLRDALKGMLDRMESIESEYFVLDDCAKIKQSKKKLLERIDHCELSLGIFDHEYDDESSTKSTPPSSLGGQNKLPLLERICRLES